jgi:peptide/nickel transport system permease protein
VESALSRLFFRFCGVLVLAVASAALAFVLLGAAPGDFLTEARLHPQISGDALEQLRARYQLDQPAGRKFAEWFLAILQGDWGRSLSRDLPVFPLLATRGLKTLMLTLGAQLAAWTLSLGLGFAVLRRPNGWLDRITSALSTLLLSVPDAVLALLTILFLTRFSQPGIPPVLAATIALVLALTPSLLKQTRDALVRAAKVPFVEAARTNDLPAPILWRFYLLPAAAPALLPLAGISIGSLLSSSLLIECIAAYPGLGPLLLEAVLARDPHVVAGCVFLSTLFWAAGSFAMDAVHWFIDPRLREEALQEAQ